MQLLQCCISPLSSHFQHVLKQLDGEKGLKTQIELKIIHLVEDHTGPLVTFLGMSNMSGVHAQVHTDRNNNHTKLCQSMPSCSSIPVRATATMQKEHQSLQSP